MEMLFRRGFGVVPSPSTWDIVVVAPVRVLLRCPASASATVYRGYTPCRWRSLFLRRLWYRLCIVCM